MFRYTVGYLIYKNPKFGRVTEVPSRKLGWELSHFAKFGNFLVL